MSGLSDVNDQGKTETQKKQCNIYETYQRKNAGFGFPGYVQHALLCIVGFTILILLFSFVRRRVWDYGILAVIKRQTTSEDMLDSKQFFEPEGRKIRRPGDKVDNSSYKKPSGFYKKPETWDRFRLRWWIRQKEIDKAILEDSSCFGWLRILISLQMEDFLHTAGPDCVKYLILQKHLIGLTFLWTLVSVGVILPVNHLGTNITKEYRLVTETEKFLSFSISNLIFAPRYLFVHLTLAMVFVLLTVIVLRRFSEYLVYFDDYEDDAYRSVLIEGITTSHKARVSEITMRDHFRIVYPDVEIREIMIIYNFCQLFYYYNYLRVVQQAILHYEAFGQLYGRIPKIVGCCCGIMCYYKCCICRLCCSTVNALDFYEGEDKRYRKLVYFEAGSRLKSRSLGMGIITFENVEMAYRFINDYSWPNRFFKKTPKSEYSRRLGTENWVVSLAPNAVDLQWDNITSGVSAWYIRFFLLNFLTVAFVIVYSTPVYFVQGFLQVLPLNRIENKTKTPVKQAEDKEANNDYITRFIYDTLPVLLLLVAAVSLPSIVAVSDLLAGFWTRSSENRSRMLKTFTFLILMIIVMPSIGLATFTKFLGDRYQIKDIGNFLIQTVLNWECILAPQNGEFFLNYMTTATLLGTLSELLRIGELSVFSIFTCCLQSPGELRSLKQQMVYEYPLGSQYAYLLLYFAMFSIFSFIFPVITPMGLLYLIVKHYVDKYNMYFAYGPGITQKELHGLASTLVMFTTYLAQMTVAFYCITQAYFNRLSPDGDAVQQTFIKEWLVFYGIVSLGITLAPSFFNRCCGWCPDLMPLFYRRSSQPDVFCGDCAPSQRKLYFPNRLEVLADEELKGFYTKQSANRRFAPEVFEELRFLTSYSGMLHKKNLPCPDSSEDESTSEDEFKKMEPLPLPLPELIPIKNQRNVKVKPNKKAGDNKV